MDIVFVLGMLMVVILCLGIVMGWLLREVSAREELARERMKMTWECTTASEALEAIEMLSELRRAARSLSGRDKSPSFRQSLAMLEVRFQLAWMSYSDGHYREARDIASCAYRQFR